MNNWRCATGFYRSFLAENVRPPKKNEKAKTRTIAYLGLACSKKSKHNQNKGEKK
jgi:hypothetical protein